MRREESISRSIDWPLFTVFVIFLLLGIANVYSAAFDPKHPELFDFTQKYGKQILWVAFSGFLGFMVMLIDAHIYRRFAIPIYLFCLTMLVVVLFMPPINGARAWLGWGSMGIQPAEFAKIGTAIALGSYLSRLNVNQQNLSTVLVASLIILVPMGLILFQPDAGTFVVFTSFLFVMYREGITYDPLILSLVNAIPGVRFKSTWMGSHFIPILFVFIFLAIVTLKMSSTIITYSWLPGFTLPGIAGVLISLFLLALVSYYLLRWITAKRDRRRVNLIVLIGFIIAASYCSLVNYGFSSLAPHQKVRIELLLGMVDADDKAKISQDYNRQNAMVAVGSGGLTGKGYQQASVASVQSNHVPESETDFIFAPLAEEWGFIGTTVLIALFLFMLLRVVQIAERQKSRFNRIYAYSVAMILFYHFAINIGMNIGLAPVIGIPLPFFSYGGSSMMSFSVMMFILLKLDSQRNAMLM